VIVGTGIDVIEVPRVASAIKRFGGRFLGRVFTPFEIAYCQTKRNAVERFAVRFAAKEATMKAIGTGLSLGVTWHDVEVRREPGGRPILVLSGQAEVFARKLGTTRSSLSMTHTAHTAMAQVILES
jgi:holo-[acyl-carrier protein] synthase